MEQKKMIYTFVFDYCLHNFVFVLRTDCKNNNDV